MRKGHRWLPAEKPEAHNRKLAPIRARIEKIFGTWKRSYRFRAMRWMGLAKARLQIHLAAAAARRLSEAQMSLPRTPAKA
jgi:hypothetical protein